MRGGWGFSTLWQLNWKTVFNFMKPLPNRFYSLLLKELYSLDFTWSWQWLETANNNQKHIHKCLRDYLKLCCSCFWPIVASSKNYYSALNFGAISSSGMKKAPRKSHIICWWCRTLLIPWWRNWTISPCSSMSTWKATDIWL